MRIKSGIQGFDNLCQGGFIKDSITLVSGVAGSGKSIFAMQFLHYGIQSGEKGLYISFEENLDDLKKDALVFGWDFDRLEREKKCRFAYIFPYELNNFQPLLISEVTRLGAKRVVIDSTSAFGMSLENEYEVRKQLFSLTMQLKKLECTTILTSEVVEASLEGTGKLSRFGVEEFVADSVIVLHYGGLGGDSDRALQIVKMRRTDHVKGPVPMKITEKGISVSGKGKFYR